MKNIKQVFIKTALLFLINGAFFVTSAIDPPGSVVTYSSPSSGLFIGSPSLLILPNGNYLASHDYFGKTVINGTTHIYCSKDNGKSWEKISMLENQFWSNLFLHKGEVYLMGTTKEYGAVIIRKSTDYGESWTVPTNYTNGILLNDGEYHTAPVPVVVHNGRIWRSMEDRYPPSDWGVNFRAFIMSASLDSDLLKASSWETTNRISYDQSWPGSAWLEGNVVVTPQGYLWNILRNHTDTGGKAAITKVGLTGRVLTFDPSTGFIEFPGGSVKFTIRFDPVSRKYYSLTNYIPERYKGGNPERTRNTLALISSVDLINWNVEKIVLQEIDVSVIGFQYADFRIEGDDLIFLSRTSYYEPGGYQTSQHDSNFLTFHRIEDFRSK